MAGGYRYQTAADLTPYVERFLLHDQRARLSGAALETLAIVAYKQPISRAQVAAIRGVDPDGVMRTLQARGYIDEVGRDTGPGQAILFGTTATFLERLGLDSVDDLPPIAEFIPGADVVEALEDGLRVTPVIEVGARPDGPGPDSPRRPSTGVTCPTVAPDPEPEPPLWEQWAEQSAAAPAGRAAAEGARRHRLGESAGLRGPDRGRPGHRQR